jgi:hypothetical protein
MSLPSYQSIRKPLLTPAFLLLAVFNFGCQTPLYRHYPAAWSEIVVLSADGTELNGTYGNEGTLVTEKGDQKPITLASLVPTQPYGEGPLKPVSSRFAETKSVSLTVRNPSKESGVSEKPWGISKKAYATMRKLEFSSDVDHGSETVMVDGNSLKRSDKQDAGYVIQFLRENAAGGSLGFVANNYSSAVWLTKSADGSLIAEVEDISFTLFFPFVPIFAHSLTWARFPRVED